MDILKSILEDTMKETQSDGTRKWSWFRIAGLLWFWIACIPTILLWWINGLVISDGFIYLTGIIYLNVLGGKISDLIQGYRNTAPK